MLQTMQQLCYGAIVVGELREVIEHQRTWFGTVARAIRATDGALQRRILEYKAFCEDFRRRSSNDEEHDACEFDAFDDVCKSGLWYVRGPGENVRPITNAPVFMEADEVSWRHD